MKNVNATMEGTTLVLRIDTTQRMGASSTGKSLIVGTTNGFATGEHIKGLPEGVMLSLNCNYVVKLTDAQKAEQKKAVAAAKASYLKGLTV